MIIYQQTNNGVVEKTWKHGDKPVYSKENKNEREVWDVIEVTLDWNEDENLTNWYLDKYNVTPYNFVSSYRIRIFGDMAKFIAANL